MCNITEILRSEYTSDMDGVIAGLSNEDLQSLFRELNQQGNTGDLGIFGKIKAIALTMSCRNKAALISFQFDNKIWLPNFIGKNISDYLNRLNQLNTLQVCAIASYLFMKQDRYLTTYGLNDWKEILDDEGQYSWGEKTLMTIFWIDYKQPL